MTKPHPLDHLIEDAIANSTPRSFLKHIEYFKGKNGINRQSIAKNWSKLTGENECVVTNLKGTLTIRAANQSSVMQGCPWKDTFQTSEEMMPCLKHACDTGFVNADGSIKTNELHQFIIENFNQYVGGPIWYLKQSEMMTYLIACAERDREMPKYGAFYVPWSIVAKAEWEVFFKTFSDLKVDNEPCVTAQTFLNFYLQPDQLYTETLAN
jgi:hypothetical protein